MPKPNITSLTFRVTHASLFGDGVAVKLHERTDEYRDESDIGSIALFLDNVRAIPTFQLGREFEIYLVPTDCADSAQLRAELAFARVEG